jgi:hypothetical protein
LRGSARSSFEYQITIKNDSGRNLLASFAAQAPRNFETSFTEAYGSQELSSIPIEAGQSKDIKLKARPPAHRRPRGRQRAPGVPSRHRRQLIHRRRLATTSGSVTLPASNFGTERS